VTTPISYARRGAQEPFDDARVETYARCRARGVSIRKSSEEANLSPISGQKIEKEDAFRERIGELKDATQAFTGVTLAAIMQRLLRNADAAAERGDYKGSNQALMQLTTLVKEDAGRVSGALRNVGARHGEKKIRENFRNLLSEPETVETTGEESPPDGDPPV
jgi:hypothetical protein